MQKFVKYKQTGVISPVPDNHFSLIHSDYEVVKTELTKEKMQTEKQDTRIAKKVK